MKMRWTLWLFIMSTQVIVIISVPIKGVCERPNLPEATYDGVIHQAAPGTIVHVTCKEKYERNSPTILCTHGKWSRPEPPCKEVMCPFPGVPHHGTIIMPCRNYNCTSTFLCSEGYVYEGPNVILCQRDKTWNGTRRECEAVSCPQLDNPENGRVVQSARFYLTTATYECDEGFIDTNPTGTKRRCMGNNKWSDTTAICEAVQCQELPDVPNGKVLQSHKTYLSTATVECNEGYVYNKPHFITRQCQGDNKWSGEAGLCRERPCINITNVDNGILSATAGSFKDTITLQCFTGHILDGPGSVSCQKDGTWSAPIGQCLKPKVEWNHSLLGMTAIPVAILIAGVSILLYKRRQIHRPDKEKPVDEEEAAPLTAKTMMSRKSHAVHTSTTNDIHVRFAVNEDFSDEYPDEASKECSEFTSKIKQAVELAIAKSFQQFTTEPDIRVTSFRKTARAITIMIRTKRPVPQDTVCSSFESVSFKGESREYTVKSNSVTCIDDSTTALKHQVLKKKHIPDHALDRRIDLDTQYVDLKIISKVHYTGVTRNSMDVKPHQLDQNKCEENCIEEKQLIVDGQWKTFILLCGRAGIGKSTFIQRLLWQWANGVWATQFRAYYVLNMRYLVGISRQMYLHKLFELHTIYQQDKDNTVVVEKESLEGDVKDIAIVLDSVDEIGKFHEQWEKADSTTETATPLQWCFRLLKRSALKDATLIVSSRPFTNLNLLQPTAVVELMGLDYNGVQQYIRKNVSEDDRKVVKHHLHGNPILLSVCAITFFCAALCLVLTKENSVTSHLFTYTQICAYILERYMCRSMKDDCLIEDMYTELSVSIRALSVLAYKGLFNEEMGELAHLTFSEEDLKTADVSAQDCTNLRKAGLLLQTEVKSPEGPQVFSEFVHLSIQEFLGMVGLLIQEPAEVEKKLSTLISSRQFDMALLFLFGLVFNSDDAVISRVRTVVQQRGFHQDIQTVLRKAILEASIGDLLALQLVHESQSKDLAMKVGQEKFPEKISLQNAKMTAVDIKALTFMLKNHNSVHTVELKNLDLDLISIRETGRFLEKNCTVTKINLVDRMLNDKWIGELMKRIAKNKALESVELSCGQVTDEGVEHVADALEENRTLKELWLRALQIGNRGGEALIHALKGNSAISIHILGHSCTGDLASNIVELVNRGRITLKFA